jgi:hypothetical protein
LETEKTVYGKVNALTQTVKEIYEQCGYYGKPQYVGREKEGRRRG